MEPNPIYWLELKQLRRGGFLYALAGAGLVMSGFLYAVIRYGIDDSPSSYFYMIPVLFYVLGVLGTPLIAGLRFAFQQVSEDLIFDTPLSGKTIVLGKFRSALVLVLCLYLPALPGVAYQAYHGETGHLIGCAACAFLTTVFSATAVGFAAGTKSAAGALGKIAWVAVYAGFGFSLFGMTMGVLEMTLYELRVDRSPERFIAVAVLCAAFWGGLGMLLPLWRGSWAMEKIRRQERLIRTLFLLWIGTIVAAIGFSTFRAILGLYVDGGTLVYVVFAASVFFFGCMVGDRETKGKSIYL